LVEEENGIGARFVSLIRAHVGGSGGASGRRVAVVPDVYMAAQIDRSNKTTKISEIGPLWHYLAPFSFISPFGWHNHDI
jgi:hypothetical protein